MDLQLHRNYLPRDPFFGTTGFDELFSPMPWLIREPFDALAPRLGATNDLLRLSSPGYEIREREDGMYQISVDVPGIKASDMNIELLHDGRVLHISGGRKTTEGGKVTETKFDKKFTIGDNIETEKMSANLADGVLILKAPKKEIKEPPKLTIAISEGPHDAKPE
jgi:HSP20 family protein